MARTLYIATINGKTNTNFKHITIDLLDEPICMNIGVALMPFMEKGYYFLKEDSVLKSEAAEGFNTIETGFTEYLYKIRQANREQTKLEYTRISGPNARTIRERIFIAGKIFPVMSISYSGKAIDCASSTIKIGSVSFYELRLLFGETFEEYKESSTRYISIDHDNIRIYLPKYTSIGIDYADLLLDFLTNGEKTKIAATHGEFPDLKTYTLATGNTKLQKGCWLTGDRNNQNDTWKNACMYIVEKKLQGVLGPFGQIADFYELLDHKIISDTTHKTRWLKGAKKLVESLAKWIEKRGISYITTNDIETILYELNIGICDYAITQFYELFYGKYINSPLNTFDKAYAFDLAFVQHEQGVIAKPIYTKTSDKTIEKYQKMADQDGIKGYTSGFLSKVIPEFDKPWNGKVTDAQFRIDLPMLMLWLDTHKPSSDPFKNKVDKNGYLLEEYKKIIRPYETK